MTAHQTPTPSSPPTKCSIRNSSEDIILTRDADTIIPHHELKLGTSPNPPTHVTHTKKHWGVNTFGVLNAVLGSSRFLGSIPGAPYSQNNEQGIIWYSTSQRLGTWMYTLCSPAPLNRVGTQSVPPTLPHLVVDSGLKRSSATKFRRYHLSAYVYLLFNPHESTSSAVIK